MTQREIDEIRNRLRLIAWDAQRQLEAPDRILAEHPDNHPRDRLARTVGSMEASAKFIQWSVADAVRALDRLESAISEMGEE